MGDMINECEIPVENVEGRDHLEDLDVDGWIRFEWILNKLGRKLVTGFMNPVMSLRFL
jgi:hypothetical protein